MLCSSSYNNNNYYYYYYYYKTCSMVEGRRMCASFGKLYIRMYSRLAS